MKYKNKKGNPKKYTVRASQPQLLNSSAYEEILAFCMNVLMQVRLSDL